MNISQVLHPEVLRNLRGNKLDREWLNRLVGRFKLANGMVSFDVSGVHPEAIAFARESINGNKPFLDFFFHCQKFLKDKGRTFYIPKDFCNALTDVDKALKISYLPTDFIGYFAFPKEFVTINTGHAIAGAYVFCGKSEDIPSSTRIPDERVFHAVLIREKDGKFDGVSSCDLSLREGKTLWENLQSYFVESGLFKSNGELLKYKDTFRVLGILLNALLFVHNEDEDILRLKPAKNPSRGNGQPVNTPSGTVVNNCSIAVELLNFNFHRGNTYSMGSTSVRGHFRWQPYGPERSKVKLVWIDEHERKFTNVEQQVLSSNVQQGIKNLGS